MVYFNQKSYTPKSKEETDQWGQVLEFQRQYPKEGLWWPYKGKAQFEGLVRSHLTNFIRKRFPIHAQVGTDANVAQPQQPRKPEGYRINGDHWQRAILRVWKGKPTKGGEWLGTSFLISPSHAVTAAHVVEQVPSEEIFLSGMAWSGVRQVEKVLYHPCRDVALLRIMGPDSPVPYITLPEAKTAPVPGQNVVAVGFGTLSEDIELRRIHISSYCGSTDALATDSSIPKGKCTSGPDP